MQARWSSAWLWLLVAVQVAIPASYYLLREDKDDERFAWRMFSAVRLKHCEVSARELTANAERPIDLPRSLHASWIRSLERGRPNVIEHFLAQRCRVAGTPAEVTESLLERRCKSASGRALPPVEYRYDCAAERFEGAP